MGEEGVGGREQVRTISKRENKSEKIEKLMKNTRIHKHCRFFTVCTYQYVLWFDIPMNNIQTMQIKQCPAYLSKYRLSILL